MKREAWLIAIGLAGTVLGVCAAAWAIAAAAAPKIEFFSAARLKAMVEHPIEGIAANRFLSGPGSNVFVIRREKTGETEVHMEFNDIYVVESGHAKITVGGHVSGNHEASPTEWLGGDISGGTDYSLAAGDVLFIPAGAPHKTFVSPNGSLTYVLVKTPK